MNIPRMRTVPEAAAELKALDEHTALTQCAIRRLVLDGRIKSVKAGRKHLINFDQLLEYLLDPFQEEEQEEVLSPSSSEKTTPVVGIDRIEQFKKNIGMR